MNRAHAITWVRQSTAYPKFFFDDAESGAWVAATGARSTYVSHARDLETIEEQLRAYAANKTRVVGGVAFDTSRVRADEWTPFASAFFFEPETAYDGVDTTLSMSAGARGAIASVEPDDAWRELFNRAQDELRNGDLEKVVLARRTELDDPIDPWFRLDRSEHAITFCIQPDADHVFWGTTPERLYEKIGKKLHCDALAGTRPRGETPHEDLLLRRDLLESEKDRDEHNIVVRYLEEALSSLSDRVDVGATDVRALDRLQHLFTPVTAELTSGDSPILSSIHPTPALCGAPRSDALDWIAENEPFDRGWYGGTVGWMTPLDACMAVAIRSALRTHEKTFVYAGAGIVEASVCDDEWNEISTKGATIELALGARS